MLRRGAPGSDDDRMWPALAIAALLLLLMAGLLVGALYA